MKNRFLRRASPLVLLALIGLVACTAESDASASPSGAEPAVSAPAATEEQVIIEDQSFSPAELTITVGTTVTWVNQDGLGHTVTHGEDGAPLQDALFDEPVSAEQVVTYTFEEPGTYPVTCKVHKDMQMTVIVEEG